LATSDYSNGVGRLTLKPASKSRPSGQWSDDDYDVFDGDRHVGRIMWTHAAPATNVDLIRSGISIRRLLSASRAAITKS
jgi:hypothetical protein